MLALLLLSAVLGQAADVPPWVDKFDRAGDPLPAGAVARFGSVRYRHGSELTDLRLSPSGQFVATRAKDDSDLRLWEATTGRQVGQMALKDTSIQHVTFLTDSILTLVAADGVYLWTSGRPLTKLSADVVPEKPLAVALSPDGKTLAVGAEKAIHLLPFETLKEVTKVLATNAVPLGLAFSPDGKWLAAENTGTVSLWEVVTGKRVRSFGVAPDRPTVRFTPQSDGFYTLTSAGVRLLRFDSDEDDAAFEPFASEKKLCDLQLSRDGKTLFVLETVGTVHRLDAKTGKVGKPITPPKDIADWPLATLAPDGKAVVSRWADQRWARWDTATSETSAAGPIIPLATLRLSPDSKTATCQDEKDCLRSWAVADGTPGRELRPRGKDAPGGAAWDIAGERLLYETEAKELLCVRVRDGEILKKVPAAVASQAIQFLAGHPSRYVRFLPEVAELGDLDGQRPTRAFPYQAGAAGCAALSPDGRLLVIGGKKEETLLIETTTGRVRLTLKLHASEVKFAPDGRTLGVGEMGGFVTLIDSVAGRHLRQVSLVGSGHTSFAFSPDGRRFATVCRGPDRTIQEWDTASGEVITEFPGPTVGSSTGIVYTPDGTRLVTCGTDGCGYVWDLRYRKPPEPLGRVFAFASVAAARAALGSSDAEEAYKALAYLVGRPADALAELRAALRPATGPTADELRGWVAKLSSKEFKDRDLARKGLLEAGAAAVAALRAEMKTPGTPESGKIAAELLAKLEMGYATSADLLAARAVEAVERIGTPDARALLTAWAGGAPLATLTTEAKAALARMK